MRPPRSTCGLPAAVLAGLLLSACGTGTVSTSNLTGDRKAIAQTISNLQADAQSRNQAHVCANDLASSVVGRLNAGSSTCTNVISKQLAEADDYSLSLASGNAITVSANTATARVTDTLAGNKNHVDVLHLVREGKNWKVAAIGPGA